MTRNTDHRAVQRITVGIGVATVSEDTVATELGLTPAENFCRAPNCSATFNDNDNNNALKQTSQTMTPTTDVIVVSVNDASLP